MKASAIKRYVIFSVVLTGIIATTNLFSQEPELFSKLRANDIEAVKHGANVNAESNEGKTPLSIATEGGYTNIEEILKTAGSK